MAYHRLSSFVPSPEATVEACLSRLQTGQRHVDIGSGDGRFVLAATAKGAHSTGYEIDPELVRKTAALGMDIRCADALDADVSQADLVTFWFAEPLRSQVIDKLRREMKPGAWFVEGGRRATPHVQISPA